jgi:ATP/maltotriose-dependent transcriptional regulator MalT
MELRLRAVMCLGSFYTPGPTARSVEELEHVAALAEQIGDADYLPLALWGLWSVSMFRNAPERAMAYAERFRATSGGMPDTMRDLLHLRMSGMTLNLLDDQAEARRRLEEISRAFDPSLHTWPLLGHHINHGLMARVYLARAHWAEGELDQARRGIDECVAALNAKGHAIALCHALCEVSIPLHHTAGDQAAARADIVRLRELADKHGLATFQAAARLLALALPAEGSEIDFTACRAADQILRTCCYETPRPWLCGMLAEEAIRRGLAAEAESWIEAVPDCPPLWRSDLRRIRARLPAP